MTTPPDLSDPTPGVTGATAETPTAPPPVPARPELTNRPEITDRRHAALIAGLGLCTVIPFLTWLAWLQAQDRSAAAIGMSDMHMNQMSVFWAFPVLQATGIAALIWAYAGVALGLVESGRGIRWLPLSRRGLDRLHRHISLLVIVLIAVHALATAYDAMGDSLLTILVPGQESWGAAKWSYDLGIIAFYLALLLGPTYYLRRRIGMRAWRFAHRFAVVVYVLSVWHTLIIGADVSYYGWVRPFMWLLQLPLLALLGRRLLRPARRYRTRAAAAIRYGLAIICAAAAAGIVIAVSTGGYLTLVHTIQ
ncbi:MAG TPA: ferric reductase-like transmembrane domain-containing protein [Streptosporangiaceae bacterium]